MTVNDSSRTGANPDDGAGLTAAAAVARAEQIADTLVDRQAETEQRSFYGPDTHEQLRAAGFYRLLVPRRYGGHELGVDTFMRVSTALARGCPSTGWMYLFGAAHALAVATLFDEPAQRELFQGGDFICPATVGPAGRAERTGDGQWLIDGTWRYCSGAPYATHFMGHVFVPDEGTDPPAVRLFVVPRTQWRRLDDWGGQLGLRGSGSHSIRIERQTVPDQLTLPGHLSLISIQDGTPGRALHHNPEYGGGPLSFMLLELGALAVGMAKGALDAWEELARTRDTVFFPIIPRTADPDYQFRYGEAVGLISTAEAALADAVRQWQATCQAGSAGFTRQRELELATISREVVRLCWRAVEGHLYPSAGSSAAVSGHRIERVWRDMSMLHSHAGLAVFLSTIANRELAMARFGISAPGGAGNGDRDPSANGDSGASPAGHHRPDRHTDSGQAR